MAAGYVVYGSSTMLVYTTGNGVYGFTLDPSIGAYVISHEHITMPPRGSIYSVNEANADSFPAAYRRYPGAAAVGRDGAHVFLALHRLAGGRFSSHAAQGRHLPVSADASRIREGKLRLLYEANPIAFLAEQAGGMATDGTQRILDIEPDEPAPAHAAVVGSRDEMELLASMM